MKKLAGLGGREPDLAASDVAGRREVKTERGGVGGVPLFPLPLRRVTLVEGSAF